MQAPKRFITVCLLSQVAMLVAVSATPAMAQAPQPLGNEHAAGFQSR